MGIGFGIVFLSAFITSQIIFPALFGRPKSIEVPNLVGMSFSKARRTLTDMGLHAVVKDSIWSETEKIETILEQDPAPGKMLKPESTVALRISSGSRQVGVPSVIGLNFHEAYFTLHSAGLKAVVADSLYSESYKVNTVIKCSPGVGSKTQKGSKVKLYISRGAENAPNKPDSLSDKSVDRLF